MFHSTPLVAQLETLTRSLERLSLQGTSSQGALPNIRKDLERLVGDLTAEQIAMRVAEFERAEAAAVEAGHIDEADRLNAEVRELREKEVLLKNFLVIEQNQNAFEQLRAFNERQVSDFNDRWEAVIAEVVEYSRRIEQSLLDQHALERSRLEEGLRHARVPPVKLSAALLNEKFRVKQMLRGKHYEAAREAQEAAAAREATERQTWAERHQLQLDRRRSLLATQHSNEYNALRARLEKTINLKLKQRMAEYEQLLQRVQNLQNEMIIKQTLEFAKLQTKNAKVLAKYSISLAEVENRAFGAMEARHPGVPRVPRSRLRSSTTTEKDSGAPVLAKAKMNVRKVVRRVERELEERQSFTTLSSSHSDGTD